MNRPEPEGTGRFRVPRWVIASGIAVVALALALGGPIVALGNRPARIDVALHRSAGAERTMLVIGVDDRSLAPEGTTDFGELDAETGARADIIVALRSGPGGVRAATITRDLFVEHAPQQYDRLATEWLRGPQAFVDSLCRTLHMSIDHVVVVNLKGFAGLVDRVGGVEVTVPQPLRDQFAHIELEAGPHLLDGRTALGYVRSRKGEILSNGSWIPDPEGASGRQRRSAEVFRAVAAKLPKNPIALYQLAWDTLPDVTVDKGTGVFDLLAFRDLPASFTKVPVTGGDGADDWVAYESPETHATLQQLGFADGCQP